MKKLSLGLCLLILVIFPIKSLANVTPVYPTCTSCCNSSDLATLGHQLIASGTDPISYSQLIQACQNSINQYQAALANYQTQLNLYNQLSQTVQQTPAITSSQAFQIITTSPLPNAYLADSYSTTINYIYSGTCTPIVTTQGLPPGISLGNGSVNASDLGSVPLVGTPTQEGVFPFKFYLSDSCGSSLEQDFSLTVISYFAKILTPAGVGATTGSPYKSTISFEWFGQTVPGTTVSGLPPGITSSIPVMTQIQQASVTGFSDVITLAGTPTQAGVYNVLVTVADATTSTPLSYPISITANPYASSNSQSTVSPTPIPTLTPQPTVTPPTTEPVAGTDLAGTNISSNGTVYMITADGQKRPYTSAGAFLSYGFNTWANVVPASSADLALPTGNFIPPRDGKIICSNKGSDKNTCYLITDSQKAAFTSAAVFMGLGFKFSDTLSGDVSFLPSAPNISSASQAHPAGVLVNKGGTIYLVGDSGLLGIPDIATLSSWGYSLSDSVPANAADSAMAQSGIMAAHTAGALSPFAN